MHHRILLALAVVAVCLLTLSPAAPSAGSIPFFCMTCGGHIGADTLVNVALFLPVGLAAVAVTGRLSRAVAISLGLSLLIEVAQYQLIPGRDASFRDILANGLGGLVGAAAFLWGPGLLGVPQRWATVLPGAAVLAIGALVALTGWLLEPLLPPSRYHARWTTRVEDIEPYRGRVLSAQIGHTAARGRLDGHAVPELRDGATVRVRALAGRPNHPLGALFALEDRGQLAFLIGLERRTVVVRYRTRAAILGFDQPDARFPRALRGVEPGDTLELGVALTRPTGAALEIAGVRRVQQPGVSAGWMLLYNIDRAPRGMSLLLRLCWLGGLVAPAGLWLRGRRTAVATTVALGAVLAVLPGLVNLRGLSPAEWAAAAGGVMIARGLAGRWRIRVVP